MMLFDTISTLSKKVESLRGIVATEEATKNAFVLPMLIALGYDVYNPVEVIPEMDCDISLKGDKVDYAIHINSQPAIIVECKHCRKRLEPYVSQLAKYYVATRARFAILTNGIEYWFFADFERANLMDSKPFFIFDVSHFNQKDVGLLEKFSKTTYSELNIIGSFKGHARNERIRKFIMENILSPSRDFVKFIVMQNNNGQWDENLISEYEPIVKGELSAIRCQKTQDVTINNSSYLLGCPVLCSNFNSLV